MFGEVTMKYKQIVKKPFPIRSLVEATILAFVLTACSKGEFASVGELKSIDSNTTSADEQIDDPANVAGGLGLACVPSDHKYDSDLADISCRLANSDNRKYEGGHKIKLQFFVKNSDREIHHDILGPESYNNIRFIIKKSDASKIILEFRLTSQAENSPQTIGQEKPLLDVLTKAIESGASAPASAPAPAQTVSAPIFSLAAGAYAQSQSITITSATVGATIYYTDDSSIPVCGSSRQYSAPITLNSNKTLKAIACKSGMTTSSVTASRYIFECGDSTYGCYDITNLAALNDGSSLRLTGSSLTITLVKADPSCQDGADKRCFRVWKDSSSDKILSASGLAAHGWQKNLNTDGRSKSSSFFTRADMLGGRTCPNNVYLNESNKFATGQCLYYQKSLPTGHSSFNAMHNPTGTFLGLWCPTQKWYAGNVAACSSIGMRVPTIYESNVPNAEVLIFSPYPTGPKPTYSPTTGVPLSYHWTATTFYDVSEGCLNRYFTVHDYGPDKDSFAVSNSGGMRLICVLPQ